MRRAGSEEEEPPASRKLCNLIKLDQIVTDCVELYG